MDSAVIENKTDLKIGWALMRVSTKNQAEVQHGSLEQQKHMLTRWSLQQSEKSNSRYEITKFFEEDISGRGKAIHKRMALMEIERAIELKTIDFIVFEKVDRLARDMIYNLGLVKKAHENGVEVHEFESGKIDLRDRGSRLGFNIKNLLAEEYSLDLEEKITKKLREARINNGKDTSTCPVLGLDPHPTKRGMYVINKKEQEILLDIFKKFLVCGSIKETADYCQSKNYRTKERQTKEKTDKDGNIVPSEKIGGELIGSKNIRNILTNPKIRGFAHFKDTWNQFPKLQDEKGMVRWEYPHGPVIPLELFDEAQQMLVKNAKFNSRIRGTVYLLSQILFYEDGTKFSGAGAHGRNEDYEYYHCRAKKFRIRKEKIESAILQRVKEYLSNSEILKKMIDETNQTADQGKNLLADRISELKTKLFENKKVIEGFSNYIRQAALSNPLQLDSVIRTITSERDKAETENLVLERELATSEKQLGELKLENQDKAMRTNLESLLKNFDKQEDKKKRDIIHLIIPRIVVHEDNKLEIWVRRDLSKKSGGNFSRGQEKFGCESKVTGTWGAAQGVKNHFGQGVASYQSEKNSVIGLEQNGLIKFSGEKKFFEFPASSSSEGLSHLEESGSSEYQMAE